MSDINNIAILTGAGISTGATLRTFRVADDLWENIGVEGGCKVSPPKISLALKSVRSISAAMLLLLVTACQPPQYDILVEDVRGETVFSAENGGFWPLKWDDSKIEAEYLEVVTASRVLWAIKTDSDNPACLTETPNPDYRAPTALKFPLQYGKLPRCFVELRKPQPLPVGQVITVRTDGLQQGYGYFRVDRRITAIDPEDAQDAGPTFNPNWQSIVQPHDAMTDRK